MDIEAGFGEARKVNRLLEEDFPSFLQHFIVDPTHFWFRKKR